MFEDTYPIENRNYSHDFEKLNNDLLEIREYIFLFLYIMIAFIACFVIVACFMYINITKRERLLKQEINQNLLNYQEEKSDD
jgi:maltodextrin utilization protein YvdJ